MSLRSAIQFLEETRARFGLGVAVRAGAHRLVNTVMFFDRLDVIVLQRSSLAPLNPQQKAKFSSRIALRADLERLQATPDWGIGPEKMQNFDQGAQCVLSFVDGELAGYTWVDPGGRPELIPGLRIRVPEDYLYNYAGFTAPQFRGSGLQAYRHHSVLGQEPWLGRRGLLGYRRSTNYSSEKGQAKSGYRKVGSIVLWGSKGRFVAHFSKSLQVMGIEREGSEMPAPALRQSESLEAEKGPRVAPSKQK